MFRASIKKAADVAKKNVGESKLTGPKKMATQYLCFTAGTTIVGGGVGATAGLALSPAFFMEGVTRSQSKTVSGQLVDGFELAGNMVVYSTGIGLACGSAPITYPLSKGCEIVRKKLGK